MPVSTASTARSNKRKADDPATADKTAAAPDSKKKSKKAPVPPVQPQPAAEPAAEPVEDAGNEPTAPKKKRGGKVPGAQKFTERDESRLLSIMEEILPISGDMWKRVAATYNKRADEAGRKNRDEKYLRKVYTDLVKGKKTTGDPLPRQLNIKRAKKIERATGQSVDMPTTVERFRSPRARIAEESSQWDRFLEQAVTVLEKYNATRDSVSSMFETVGMFQVLLNQLQHEQARNAKLEGDYRQLRDKYERQVQEWREKYIQKVQEVRDLEVQLKMAEARTARGGNSGAPGPFSRSSPMAYRGPSHFGA